MFKSLLAALLLTIGSLSHANDRIDLFKAFEAGDDEVILRIGSGYDCLEEGQFASARANFKEARRLFEEFYQEREIEFLLMFGELITYDNLGFRGQCEKILGRFVIHLVELEDDFLDEDEEETPLSQEQLAAIRYLRSLASLALSPDIARVLHSFIDELEDN